MNDNLFMKKLSRKILALIVQKLLSTAFLLAEAPFLTQGTVHVIKELKEDTFVTYMFDVTRGVMAAIKLRSGLILVHSDVFSWVLSHRLVIIQDSLALLLCCCSLSVFTKWKFFVCAMKEK